MSAPGAGEARARSGTLVVRDRRVTFASGGVAELLERPVESLLGADFVEFLAPEDQARLEDRYLRRLRGEPVPGEYEARLALPDGRRRTVEVQASVEGTDLVLRLHDVSAQAARRPRLAGVAALGVAIQGERTEAEIFRRVRAGLAALDLDSAVLLARPDGVEVAWATVPPALDAALRRSSGRGPEGFTGPWTPFHRAAWEAGEAYSDDWALTLSAVFPAPVRDEVRRATADAGSLRAAALRLEERGGPARLLLVVGAWLHPGDLPALRLFAAQVVAALDSARAIGELSDRNFELAALNRLGELAGGAVGLDAFLPAAGEVVRATAGCEAVVIFAADHDAQAFDLLHAEGTPPDLAATWGRVPFSSPLGGVVLQRRLAVEQAADQRPQARAWLEQAGFTTLAWVPLVIRSRVLGAMVIGWRAPRLASACRADLLLAMGAHVAAAMEAHDLLRDLRRRVGELTLLNDVAQATGSLDPVLLLENALRRMCDTFEADGGVAFLADDGALVQQAAFQLSPESRALLARLDPGEGPAGLAMARQQPVTEVTAAQLGVRCAAAREREGFRAMVAVPLLTKGEAVGALCLGRRSGRPFDAGAVSLLSALGVQLGVAVEAARQHAQTERRARDLAAVNALTLRVFGSAPGDAPRLLQEACAEVAAAFSARHAVIMLLDAERRTLSVAASHGLPVPPAAQVIRLDRPSLEAEALRARAAVTTLDTSTDPRSATFGAAQATPMAMLAVPLTARGQDRGAILVGDQPGRHFSPADRALAVALGGELALALENAEHYAEARRRAEELALLQEVGRSLVESLELQHVLDAGVQALARTAGAPAATLLLTSDDGQELEIKAVAGQASGLLGRRVPAQGPSVTLAGLALERRAAVAVEDLDREPRNAPALQAVVGARAILALPLLVRDRPIGAAVILETAGPRRFTPAEIERASAVANQLAVGVDNARSHARALAANQELRRANERNLRQERLAALGELSAVVAHEVRNPLGVIFNSLGSLKRLLRPEGDARMLLDILGEESDRLNRIVGDLLDFAQPASPQVRLEPFDRVVDDAVAAALAQPPAPVELVRHADPRLATVPLDGRLVRQALLNVAMNAVQAMPRGGRLTVRTRLEARAAVVEVEDTGPGIADDVRDRIFEPFFTTKATGTGLGLAVVKRIVEGHGGEISVRSRPGAGSIFTLCFPLPAGPGDAEVEMPGGIGSSRSA